MTDEASLAGERLSDTLIAAAILILLIVGWVQGLGGAELERLWALRTYLVSTRTLQVRFDRGPLRKGAYSASSLPAAST